MDASSLFDLTNSTFLEMHAAHRILSAALHTTDARTWNLSDKRLGLTV
jgi:hypothetical protein